MVAQQEEDVVEGLMVAQIPKDLGFSFLAQEPGPPVPHGLTVGRNECGKDLAQARQVYVPAFQHRQGSEDSTVCAQGLLGDGDLTVLSLLRAGAVEVKPEGLASALQAHR